ncbi:hypothetical protein Save01_01730 [Streptomyces avermitilis]|uniref:Lipoprotein n=1 Tax=Streptomyces avermitilis TaxID=33903 RepID=A0A4D4MJ85_STRAX|nr:hypothetical protein SAV31267_012000 [Streptomyces avermitilis]GDY80899.1 hypothetical protein SAVCW2_00980 [Streptomyces avermitilis]
MRIRKWPARAVVPALAASALLLASGCSAGPDQGSPSSAGRASGAAATGAATADADRSLAVAAAPAADATPTAVAHSGAAGGRAHKTALKVSSYDNKTRRAVISRASKATSTPSTGTTPSGGSTPSAGGTTAPGDIAVGDVIASAPAPGAPDGLLAEVTKVIGGADDGTEVQTAPTTLDTLLGDGRAKGSVPVDPASFDIDRLLPDVKISWARTGGIHSGPEGTKVPLGSLRVDVAAKVPAAEGAPVSADASVSGFVQVAPEVDFSYGGGAAQESAPGSAYLGVSGDWTSRWALKGRAAAATKPLRVPFAKLHADPVLQVGPIPVVVNLDLTCYFEISGDGSVTVDIEQDLRGDFKAGGAYGPAKGWTPVNESTMTSTPVRASVTTAGKVKAALGAQASVGLYGTVGVTADLAPYLRGEAEGSVKATSGTGSGKAAGTSTAAASWAVYGGVDLSGTLRIQLAVFGTPVFQRDIPLGALHREWKLADGKA